MSTQIPAPRSAFIDSSGRVDRIWYLFLLAIRDVTGVASTFLSHQVTTSGDYVVTTNDWAIYCTGTMTVFLQHSGTRDKELVVTNAGAGIVTLQPTGGETINGKTSMTIDFQWTTLQLRPASGGYIIQ